MNKLKTIVLGAGIAVLAASPVMATDMCMGLGTTVLAAATARDAGVSYHDAVRAFNHGYDQAATHDATGRAVRRIYDASIKAVYQQPRLAPRDEQARIVGVCEMQTSDPDAPAPEDADNTVSE